MAMRNLGLGLGLGAAALLLLTLGGSRRRSPTPPSPVPSVGGSVADVAARELGRWSGLTEDMPQAEPLLRAYWAATGQAYPGPGTAWSAAFVVWVVKHSTAPNALASTGAHIYYARQAYLDRGTPGRYGAYRPEEVQVGPGDILVRGRVAGEPFSFADLTRTTRDYIPTHGDVVVAVSEDEAVLVGGNLDNAVGRRTTRLVGGVAADPAVVAVLKYQPGGRVV